MAVLAFDRRGAGELKEHAFQVDADRGELADHGSRTEQPDRGAVDGHLEAAADQGVRRVRVVPGLDADDLRWARPPGGGHHHMGTTRMHEDARRGVVDADARVHGVENLYVAGPGIFATAGASNPTYTIFALSMRGAENLAGNWSTVAG